MRPPALRLLWFSSVLPGNLLWFCFAVAFKLIKTEVLQEPKWLSRYTGLGAGFPRDHGFIQGNDKRPEILWGSPTLRLSRYEGFSGSTATLHDAYHSLYLVLMLRMSGSVPPLSHRSLWHAQGQLQFIARAFTGWSNCPCYNTEMKTIGGHDGRQSFHLGPSNQQTS